MKRSHLFVLAISIGMSAAAHAQQQTVQPAQNSSNNPAITVPDAGTLKVESARIGSGAVGSFTPLRRAEITYCSGSCNGNSVGSWTCSDGKSCDLNCTTTPPTKGCY